MQFIDAGGCDAAATATLSTAILHAAYLAQAGLTAASNFSNPPFSFFFEPDPATANIVAPVLQAVVDSQQGKGNLVSISCADYSHRCDDGLTAAYTLRNGVSIPTIVTCPRGLALPTNQRPCKEGVTPGTISLGWLMLHETVHVISDDIIDEKEYSAKDLHLGLLQGQDTANIASAYAYMSSYAWDLGLGGPPWNQQSTCLDKFRFDNFTQKPSQVATWFLSHS